MNQLVAFQASNPADIVAEDLDPASPVGLVGKLIGAGIFGDVSGH